MPEDAAIRELEEETGFQAGGVVETSPLLVCDPGAVHRSQPHTYRLIAASQG